MHLVRVTPLMNFTFSDDSLFLKKNLGGGHKFSEFACFTIIELRHEKTCLWHMRKQSRRTAQLISAFVLVS